MGRVNELGEEGNEEERRLGVEHRDQETLSEDAP
jgi:hypothetical protein